MVRTRAKKGTTTKASVKEEDDQNLEKSWNLWLMDFERDANGRLQKIEEKLNSELDSLDVKLELMLGQLPSDEANLVLWKGTQGDSVGSIESFNSTLTSTIKKPGKGFVTSTAFKPMPPPEPKTTTRQSRAKTRRTRTSSLSDISAMYPEISTTHHSTRRMTRSSSQPRDPYARLVTEYQTPMNKPDRPMNPVTPKVDPYCPMPLKRYARQGEMAISLTGSPLMITANITEPNISLPLNNGQEVYSILPNSGPCPAIPSIDSHTRKKLQILRENLSKILGD